MGSRFNFFGEKKKEYWIILTDSKTGETRVDHFMAADYAGACYMAKMQYSNLWNPSCRRATLRDRYSPEYFTKSGKFKKAKTIHKIKKPTTKKMAYAKTTYRKKRSSAKVPARIYSKLTAKAKAEIKRVVAGKSARPKKKRVSKGLLGLGFLGL